MKITWSYRGRNSLKDIIEYLAQHDPTAARKVHQRIIEKITLLKDTPYLGVQYEMNLRRLSLGNFPYSIYYRMEKSSIQILRVRHEKQLPPIDFY